VQEPDELYDIGFLRAYRLGHPAREWLLQRMGGAENEVMHPHLWLAREWVDEFQRIEAELLQSRGVLDVDYAAALEHMPAERVGESRLEVYVTSPNWLPIVLLAAVALTIALVVILRRRGRT